MWSSYSFGHVRGAFRLQVNKIMCCELFYLLRDEKEEGRDRKRKKMVKKITLNRETKVRGGKNSKRRRRNDD